MRGDERLTRWPAALCPSAKRGKCDVTRVRFTAAWAGVARGREFGVREVVELSL